VLVLLKITMKNVISGFTGGHIGLPESVEGANKKSSGSLNIFRESHECVSHHSKRFGSGGEKIGVGAGNFSPSRSFEG
jgi:hypothetical protein